MESRPAFNVAPSLFPFSLPLIRLRRGPLLPPLLLMALALLQGCRPPAAEVLHLYLVPADLSAAGASRALSNEMAAPVLKAFQRLHPDVVLHGQVIQEERLEQHLRERQRRGLGPDLLLTRGATAISLARQGLIDPVPSSPAMAEIVESVVPSILQRARDRGRLAGLPVAHDVTLACFDRRRVSSPPQSLEQLLALAASGATVGLAVDPIGIWWTSGGFAATDALAPLINGVAHPGDSARQDGRQALERWLQWLRQASLQSRVDIGSTHSELLSGLAEGRLAWVPCFSLALIDLQKRMGDRLGVSALPSGPEGPATPYTTVRVWAFGRDSSPRQRQLAEELARLSLNPMLQRQITLTSQSSLPVNRFVSIPFSDSGRLAAMAQAQNQFLANADQIGLPFSADRLRSVLPRIESIVYQSMTGLITPSRGAELLLELELELEKEQKR